MLLGNGSCAPSGPELCSNRLPEFQAKLTQSLALFRLPESGRSPASAVSREELENLSGWAQKSLREVEGYVDWVEAQIERAPDPESKRYFELRQELHAAANDLVTFHGYLHESQLVKARGALMSVQQHTAKVTELACSGPPLPLWPKP